MTREEFKKELDAKSYKWREEGEWIIIEEPGYVGLSYLETIPNNVYFNSGSDINLMTLKSMGDNIQFNNGDSVNLISLESIPDNVEFNNGGSIHLRNLESIGNNVQFNNGGYVVLDSLKSIPINIDTEVMFPKCKDIYIKGVWINGIQFPNSGWTSVDGKVKMYESWVKNNY